MRKLSEDSGLQLSYNTEDDDDETETEKCPYDTYKKHRESIIENDGENRNPSEYFSAKKSIFFLVNYQLTASVLTVPMIVNVCGIIPTVIIVVLMYYFTISSSFFILKCKEITFRYSYSVYSFLSGGRCFLLANKIIFFFCAVLSIVENMGLFSDAVKSFSILFYGTETIVVLGVNLSKILSVLMVAVVLSRSFSGGNKDILIRYCAVNTASVFCLVLVLVILAVFKDENAGSGLTRDSLLPSSSTSFKSFTSCIISLLNIYTFQHKFFSLYLPLKPKSSNNMKSTVVLASLTTTFILLLISLTSIYLYNGKISDILLVLIREDMRGFIKSEDYLTVSVLFILNCAYMLKSAYSVLFFAGDVKKNLADLSYFFTCEKRRREKSERKEEELIDLECGCGVENRVWTSRDFSLNSRGSDNYGYNNNGDYLLRNIEYNTADESSPVSVGKWLKLLSIFLICVLGLFVNKIIYIQEIMGGVIGNYLCFLGPGLFFRSITKIQELKHLFCLYKFKALIFIFIGVFISFLFCYNQILKFCCCIVI